MILTQGEKMVWAAAFVKTKSLKSARDAVWSLRELESIATNGLQVDDDDENLQMLRAMLGDEG